jgi:hypothetical protein
MARYGEGVANFDDDNFADANEQLEEQAYHGEMAKQNGMVENDDTAC